MAHGYPAVGELELPPGIFTGQDILSHPDWLVRRANGLLAGDYAN